MSMIDNFLPPVILNLVRFDGPWKRANLVKSTKHQAPKPKQSPIPKNSNDQKRFEFKYLELVICL